MIKKYSFLFLVAFFSLPLYAIKPQTGLDFDQLIRQKKFTVGGFVRLDTFVDTRQVYGGNTKIYFIYPLEPSLDPEGNDINDHGRLGFTPETSRFFIRTQNIDIGKKTKLDGIFEGDFVGETIGSFRIRHAAAKLIWKKGSLLFGQFWHPLYPSDCSPNIVGFAGGIPMATYARYPQLRLTYKLKKLDIFLTAYSQFQAFSSGPAGKSINYIQNSTLPGLNLATELRTEHVLAGATVNLQFLDPQISTTTTPSYKQDQTLASWGGALYSTLDLDKLTIRAFGFIGQNAANFYTLGGYAIKTLDNTTGKATYANVASTSFWLDLEYLVNEHVIPGLFTGYVKNLGSSQTLYTSPVTGLPTFYGMDTTGRLASVFRIATRLVLQWNQLQVAFEADYARAWFGTMNNRGKYPTTSGVGNLRFLVVTRYNF